jgi:hypothetical protein
VKKFFSFFFSSIALFALLFLLDSCKKINESTEIGSGLIPAVDNINTFADTLNVEAYNEVFSNIQDSTRVGKTATHYLGQINNDPLFGKTTASIFLEVKPTIFPFAFASSTDLNIDSVVLVLGYRETYGDTTIPQRVNVFEINQSSEFRADTAYLIRSNPATYSNLLGSKTFVPKDLNDSVNLFREKAANQLRIKLNDSFGQLLLSKEGSDSYKTDSAFKKFFKGFAVVPDASMGNAVMGFQLNDTNTKLAIYYTYTKDNKKDTTVNYFRFNTILTSSSVSANANLVTRDFSGSPLQAALGGATPDQIGYIQNTPGTYVRVKIPGLSTLSNRIIHRAELIVQQVAHPSDALFTPPQFLLLDAYNEIKNEARSIPYDFIIDQTGQINFEQFGLIRKTANDGAGNLVNVWRFNISRYIQHVVNKTEPVYDLRLSSPYLSSFLFGNVNATRPETIGINEATTKYRVRVGGGNHPTQPMRLRIVYSNINN